MSHARLFMPLTLLLFASCGPSPHDMGDAAVMVGPATHAVCSSTPTTWSGFGQSFFTTYCTRCHSASVTGAARVGAPVGLDYDSVTDVRAHAAEIDQVAASGPSATNTFMPFTAPRPTVAERVQLGQLLACGVPD